MVEAGPKTYMGIGNKTSKMKFRAHECCLSFWGQMIFETSVSFSEHQSEYKFVNFQLMTRKFRQFSYLVFGKIFV